MKNTKKRETHRNWRLASKIEALEKEMEKEEASADELRERITPHLRKWAKLAKELDAAKVKARPLSKNRKEKRERILHSTHSPPSRRAGIL